MRKIFEKLNWRIVLIVFGSIVVITGGTVLIHRQIRIGNCIDRVLAGNLANSEVNAGAICRTEYDVTSCGDLRTYFNEKCSPAEQAVENTQNAEAQAEESQTMERQQALQQKCQNLVAQNYKQYFYEGCKQLSSIESFYHCGYPASLLSQLFGNLNPFQNILYGNEDDIIALGQEYQYRKVLNNFCNSSML